MAVRTNLVTGITPHLYNSPKDFLSSIITPLDAFSPSEAVQVLS